MNKPKKHQFFYVLKLLLVKDKTKKGNKAKKKFLCLGLLVIYYN